MRLICMHEKWELSILKLNIRVGENQFVTELAFLPSDLFNFLDIAFSYFMLLNVVSDLSAQHYV